MIGHREAEISEALRTMADGRGPAAKSQAATGGSGDLVLVLNSGSSSVKFALLLPGSGERLMGGIGERLGTPEALLRVQWFPAAAVEERLPGGTHRAVVARVLGHLAEGRAFRRSFARCRSQGGAWRRAVYLFDPGGRRSHRRGALV